MLLLFGVAGFANVLIWGYVEHRFLQEGVNTVGAVVKGNYQGAGESRKYLLIVEYIVPFEARQNAYKAPRQYPVCAVKNAKWPHWLPPGHAHNILNGMQLDDQTAVSSAIQPCYKSSFRSAVAVDPENYEKLKVGSSASIRYMQSNPGVARLTKTSFRNPVGFISSRRDLFLGWPIMLGFSFFCFVGGLGWMGSSLVSGYRLLRLGLYGRCAQARIIDRWINVVDGDEGSVSQYCVAYQFQPSMALPQVAAEINCQIYHETEIGSEVIVKFLPQHSEVCRLLGMPRKTQAIRAK